MSSECVAHQEQSGAPFKPAFVHACLAAVNDVKRGAKKRKLAAGELLPTLPTGEAAVTAAERAAEDTAQGAAGAEEQGQAQAPPSIGQLLREGADVVVVDEAHILKNENVSAARILPLGCFTTVQPKSSCIG